MLLVAQGCPRFSHLTLTGGAIGSGIPMAVGAAIACPERKVINLQVSEYKMIDKSLSVAAGGRRI